MKQEMMAAGNEAYTELKNVVAWVKKNAGMGRFYRSRHELVAVKVGTLQRDEQVARPERTGVGGDIREGAIGAVQATAACVSEFRERALHDPSSDSVAATTSWSRNTRRSRPRIW